MKNSNIQSVSALFSLINIGLSGGVFAALAYYSGRLYLEGYYQGIGIPLNIVNYDFVECIYSSVRSVSIFISFLIALILYHVIKFLIMWELRRDWSIIGPVGLSQSHEFKGIPKFERPNIFIRNYFWFPTIIYVFILLMLAWTFTISDLGLRGLLQLPFVLVCLLYAYMLTQERKIASLFIRYKRKRTIELRHVLGYLFLFSLVFVIWLSFSAPFSWGQAKGIGDWSKTSPTGNVTMITSEIFPAVEISVTEPDSYPSISWVSVNSRVWKSNEPLYVLLSSDTDLYIRRLDKNSEIIIVNRNQVVAIQYIDR